MIERVKNYLMKRFRYDTEYELNKVIEKGMFSFFMLFSGISLVLQSIYFHNIYLGVCGCSIIGLALLYVVGWWAIEKERKATWKREKTMEMGEAHNRSNTWEKAHPILNFLQSCHYEIDRKKEIPEDTYYNIKYFIQRGKRGYSRRDVWGFYEYLTDIMIGGLKELQGMVHGYPSGLINSHAINVDGESTGIKEWKKIIGKIIWTFEAIQKIENHEWVLVEDESKRKELRNFVRRLNKQPKDRIFDNIPPNKWHLMTKKEMDKYNEGWTLLRQYWFSLWD